MKFKLKSILLVLFFLTFSICGEKTGVIRGKPGKPEVYFKAFKKDGPKVGHARVENLKAISEMEQFLKKPGLKVENVECLTSDDTSYTDSPGIASDRKGTAWIVWLNRLKNDREVVCTRQYRNGKWSDTARITPDEGKYENPCIACTEHASPMAAWIRLKGDKWIIESSLYDGEKFGEVKTAVSNVSKVKNPCLIAGENGTFWLAWEAYKNGKFKIFLKEYKRKSWGKAVEVTNGEKNSYEPALALDKSGRVWIAYSVAEKGQKNICLTYYEPKTGKLGKVTMVAIKETYPYANSSPDVICDVEGKVWITWERRGVYKPGITAFGRMTCQVVCYDKGKLYTVAPQSQAYSGMEVFKGENDRFSHLAFDGHQRLWLFSRCSHTKRRSWGIRASLLEADRGWRLADSLIQKFPGRLDKVQVALVEKDNFLIAWQGDDYLAAPITRVKSNIYVAKVLIPSPEEAVRRPVLKEVRAGEYTGKVLGRPWVKRRKIKVGKEKYTLLFGNLHEHSNISRCWADCSDGTLDENYRYGRDVEGYDFVALTDHGYDLYETAWRRTRRAAQFYNEPPYFVALPAYEWTLSGENKPAGSGHRNVIFCSNEDAARFVWKDKAVYGYNIHESNRIDKVWSLLRDKEINAVTIPHHPADRTHPMDWDFHDPEYQTVVEIYQCRLSAECQGCPLQTQTPTRHKGCWVRDALARGYRLGIIASGDHNSMGIGVAAVFVKEVSRKGIIEALRARRCYGTTGDKIFIDFRMDGHLMGEEYTGAKFPEIEVKVEGTDKMKKIEVIKYDFWKKEWKVIHTEKSQDSSQSFNYVDNEFSADSLYYIRVIQDNNQLAWSSPIWVNKP